jgi:hypothetical protein
MSLHEHVSDCFKTAVRFQEALIEIARGRKDNGRALGGETARQLARRALTDMGRSSSVCKPDPEGIKK